MTRAAAVSSPGTRRIMARPASNDSRNHPSADGDGVVLDLVVQPRASREGFAGMQGGALKVRLTAPPVDGEANEALVRLLAARFGIPRRQVEILAGERGRRKKVRLRGVTGSALAAILAECAPQD